MSEYTERLAGAAQELGDWHSLSFFGTPFRSVLAALMEEKGVILPPAPLVFSALRTIAPPDTRVVILGQDPYPTRGHANGLAFSVQPDVIPIPRSLQNIFKELDSDTGETLPNGDLSGWAAQGVLLLNTALTVREGEAGSHAKIGWQNLTQQIIAMLAGKDGMIWLLWGKQAQSFTPLIRAGKGRNGLIIETAHPSPLSARRGFFGSKPFSRTNDHLKKLGQTPIDWIA